MRFVTNLRPQTYRAFTESQYEPQAWLLSSHRVTPQTADLAAMVRTAGFDLFADNGTKPMIDDVLDSFATSAADLRRDYKHFKKSLPSDRRVPYMSEIPDDLRARADELADQVLTDVDRLWSSIDDDQQLGAQLAMDPSHLVAKEDFAIAALLGLGLERELLGWRIGRYTTRNRRTVRGWRQAAEATQGETVVFATLAAADYQTARHAALEAADAGVAAVAVGFAGLNKDMTYTDTAFLARRRRLERPGPRRYVRLVEILLGLSDGYSEAGSGMTHFHGLGMGSRSQFPLLQLVLGERTKLSVDATSPLHDAVRDRVLYDSTRSGNRVSLISGAQRTLVGEADRVPDGPFLSEASRTLGHDPAAARDWWNTEGQRSVSWEDLRPGRPLAEAMPVYASGRGGSTSFQEGRWVAHNHWVVDQLTQAIGSHNRSDSEAAVTELLSSPSVTVRNGVRSALEVMQLHRG